MNKKHNTPIDRKPFKGNRPVRSKRNTGDIMKFCKQVRDAAYLRMTENDFSR